MSKGLIKNYGLYWSKEDVFWGKPKVPGNLLGQRKGAKRSDYVDFRDQAGIYVLYANYTIVYIGQAGNGNAKLYDRLKSHLTDDLAGRWNQFSWFGIRKVLKANKLAVISLALSSGHSSILNHIEAILIHSSEPALNRQGGRWGKAVQRFLQHRDEENLGKTEIEMLKEIHSKKKK